MQQNWALGQRLQIWLVVCKKQLTEQPLCPWLLVQVRPRTPAHTQHKKVKFLKMISLKCRISLRYDTSKGCWNLNQGAGKVYNVKGNLKRNVRFLESIGAPDFILNVIKRGYMLPLESLPMPVYLKNSKSAVSTLSLLRRQSTSC